MLVLRLSTYLSCVYGRIQPCQSLVGSILPENHSIIVGMEDDDSGFHEKALLLEIDPSLRSYRLRGIYAARCVMMSLIFEVTASGLPLETAMPRADKV